MQTNVPSLIEASFKRFGVSDQTERGKWVVAFQNGHALPCAAWIEGNWLCMDAPLDWQVDGLSVRAYLRSHPSLSGAAKFSYEATRARLHIQAEVPVGEDYSLDCHLTETLRSVQAILSKTSLESENTASESVPILMEPLETAFKEAGLGYLQRSSGRLSVEIAGRRGIHHVLVEPDRHGFRLNVPLISLEGFGDNARHGLSLFLLSVSRITRWARPYAGRLDGDDETAGLEIRLTPAPTPPELICALGALNAAVPLCSEEVLALWDETVAQRFLLVHQQGERDQ